MPKYRVTVEETVVYKVEVEADDADQAGEIAVEIIVQAESTDEFFSHVDEREYTDAELIE